MTRVNALRTGEVDVIDHPDPKTTRLLQQDPNLQVVQLKGLRHFTMPMLMDTPPYDNNDVRLALKYAVDRRELVDKVLRNLGEVGNDHPIGSANRYHATLEEIPQREYDPDKAKFHLKKGGAEGYTFKLSTSEAAFGEAVDFAVLVKEHAAVAGIDIDIERMPIDGYWDEVWIKHEWCMSFWSGRPTEDWMFSQAYSSGAAWNESRFEHERFNKLLKGGAHRTERHTAPGDVRGDAAHPASRGRQRGPRVQRPGDGRDQEAPVHPPAAGAPHVGRLQRTGTLVVCLMVMCDVRRVTREEGGAQTSPSLCDTNCGTTFVIYCFY